jgi:hypothetical protein
MSKKELLIALLEEMESDLARIDWQDWLIGAATAALVLLWILSVSMGWM